MSELLPLSRDEAMEHITAMSLVPEDKVRNYALVVVTTDGGLKVISPDPHRDCISQMLGIASLELDDQEQPDCGPYPFGIIPDDEK